MTVKSSFDPRRKRARAWGWLSALCFDAAGRGAVVGALLPRLSEKGYCSGVT